MPIRDYHLVSYLTSEGFSIPHNSSPPHQKRTDVTAEFAEPGGFAEDSEIRIGSPMLYLSDLCACLREVGRQALGGKMPETEV